MGIWAAIKYAMNSTLGTSSFSPLDKIIKDGLSGVDTNVIRLRGGVQTFTSNGTFTVPAGITKIWVTACAGGGKGVTKGGGGDGGDWIYRHPYTVTAGSEIAITVGKGAKEKGQAGGSTVIGSLVTLACPGIRGGKGGRAETEFMGQPGFAPGGYGDSPNSTDPLAGGGGGSLGRGGSFIGQAGERGILGGGSSGTRGYAPLDGGDGIVIIEW